MCLCISSPKIIGLKVKIILSKVKIILEENNFGPTLYLLSGSPPTLRRLLGTQKGTLTPQDPKGVSKATQGAAALHCGYWLI